METQDFPSSNSGLRTRGALPPDSSHVLIPWYWSYESFLFKLEAYFQMWLLHIATVINAPKFGTFQIV